MLPLVLAFAASAMPVPNPIVISSVAGIVEIGIDLNVKVVADMTPETAADVYFGAIVVASLRTQGCSAGSHDFARYAIRFGKLTGEARDVSIGYTGKWQATGFDANPPSARFYAELAKDVAAVCEGAK